MLLWVPSVLWRCWLGSRKGIRPLNEWWGAGMVICLERGAHLHAAQLMPLPLTVSCFSRIQIGFTFLVPAHPGRPGQRAVNGCVCKMLLLQDRSQLRRVHLPKTIEHLKIFNNARETEVSIVACCFHRWLWLNSVCVPCCSADEFRFINSYHANLVFCSAEVNAVGHHRFLPVVL